MKRAREDPLFDVACGFTCRVPLTKLVGMDGNVHLYLAMLMVGALMCMGKTLVMPKGMQIIMITRKAFKNILLKDSSHNCNNYGLVSR